jgi:hypothetical protein
MPTGATPSEAPVPTPRKANAASGAMPSGMGCARKPSSILSRTSRTTERSKRPSSRTTTPGPRSSVSWCCGWHRYCGVCVAPPRSRPICFGYRPRFCATAEIGHAREVSRSGLTPCPYALSEAACRCATIPGKTGTTTVISGQPSTKPLLTFPMGRLGTSHHETWRIASSGSPISTMACSSGLDDMKPPCGARWCRPSSCSNQSDGDKQSAI